MVELSERFDEALLWARQLHQQQRRKGSEVPYFSHLLGVASLALEHGADEDEAIAALLHDAAEDQGGASTLQQIEERFGARVAQIVKGCSDTFTTPKPPWRERKEAYLAHLKQASHSERLVSGCDKLHNVRSILRDFRTLGNELWSRFRGGREGTRWYYQQLLAVYRSSGKPALVQELSAAIDEMLELTS